MSDPICIGHRNGRRCRKHAMWIVDGYPVCDYCRREYPFSRLPARNIRTGQPEVTRADHR